MIGSHFVILSLGTAVLADNADKQTMMFTVNTA